MVDQTQTELKETAEQTKSAAQHTASAAQFTKDSADRRTELAADRTIFAAERTYAAWVRTGLVALASGIGVRKLLEGILPGWLILLTGSVLILFSAMCFVAGVWRQFLTGAPPPNPDVPRLPPFMLVAVNAFLALVAVAVLVGILFGNGAS